jgi:hypothetical protein
VLGGKRAKSRFRSSISTAMRIAENCELIVPKGRNDELLAPPGKAGILLGLRWQWLPDYALLTCNRHGNMYVAGNKYSTTEKTHILLSEACVRVLSVV